MRFLAALALMLATCADAATVDVTVRNTRGAAIAGAMVSVGAPADEIARHPELRWKTLWGRTDVAGHARISVEPGRWIVDAELRGFIKPSQNPRAPPVPIQSHGPGDAVTAELVLTAGSRVRVTLEANRLAPAMSVSLGSLDGTATSSLSVSERRLIEETSLLPGRWRLHPDVPPGWILTGLVVNGAEMPGADAVLLLEEGGELTDVVVTIDGMARIAGNVSIDGPEPCNGQVVATLVEPGPWLAAARARGGSTFSIVPARIVSRLCDWEAIVPSGRWSLDVTCSGPCDVEPQALQIDVVPGEDRRVDFSGAVPAGPQGPPSDEMVVTVSAPDGTPLGAALVEATDARAPGKILVARTREDGTAHLAMPGGRTGAVHIVAGHPDHLDADAEWSGPPRDAPAIVPGPSVTLRASAALAARSRDAEGRPFAGAQVGLDVTAEPPDLLTDEKFRRLRRTRLDLTDAEGRLEWKGLHAGEVKVTARVAGADEDSWIVSLAGPGIEEGADARAALLQLVEGETTPIEIRVRPSARIVASLDPRCGLPREVEVRVVPSSALHDGEEDIEALLRASELRLSRMPRSGSGDLEIPVGPLRTGSWIVAVRPEGFDRWDAVARRRGAGGRRARRSPRGAGHSP